MAEQSPNCPFTAAVTAFGKAATGVVVDAPFERVLTVLRTQHANPAVRSGAAKSFTGAVDLVKRSPLEFGVASFWRGTSAGILRLLAAKYGAAFFDAAADRLTPSLDGKLGLAVGGAAWLLKTGATVAIVYPLDLARARLAADLGPVGKREFAGVVDCLQKVVARTGVLSLYRGAALSVLRGAAYSIVHFALFEATRPLFRHKKTTILMKFAIAQCTSALTYLAVYPLETVRARIQMTAGEPSPLYRGVWDCVSTIVREEGAVALWKGVGVGLAKNLCASLLLVSFDVMRGALQLGNVKTV